MTDGTGDLFELVHGSGNVFANLGMPYAAQRQLHALLAAEIIKTLDAEKLTVRAAEARTGVAAADFSRIRNVKLGRSTIDRLMTILDRLGCEVQVDVAVVKRAA
jgi:predicted XRE-type DNA-binding protein